MVSVMLYPCMLCVALSMDLFVCCVFDSVVEVLYWIDYVISSFRSLRAGSQVFALLMLFLCVILHTMSSGKSLQLRCIFLFGMLCLSASELCPVSFLVVGECPSVLL